MRVLFSNLRREGSRAIRTLEAAVCKLPNSASNIRSFRTVYIYTQWATVKVDVSDTGKPRQAVIFSFPYVCVEVLVKTKCL